MARTTGLRFVEDVSEDEDEDAPDPNDGGSDLDSEERSFLDRNSRFGLRLLGLITSFMEGIEDPDEEETYREKLRRNDGVDRKEGGRLRT